MKVLVVGAGWSGAVVARELHDAGVDVHVVERAEVVGGHARCEVLNGVVYEPNGAHIFHTSNQRVAEYVQRFGMTRPYEHRVLTEVFLREDDDGHGPTALCAYRRALDTGAQYTVGVDGDGQFLGSDIRRVLVLLEDGGEGVCGVRRFRYDPWFRMLMTRVLRVYISRIFGVSTRDANCPLRGYQAGLLDELLRWIPDRSLIPNVHLAILAARRGATLVEVDVNHRVRRGASTTGTMFSSMNTLGVFKRLAAFSLKAVGESWRFRHDLNSGRRPMQDARRADAVTSG